LSFEIPLRRSEIMSIDKKDMNPRRYPPFWERFVPIVLAILGVVIAGMMVVAVSIALGIFPGSM
jgi:hypothetical protein